IAVLPRLKLAKLRDGRGRAPYVVVVTTVDHHAMRRADRRGGGGCCRRNAPTGERRGDSLDGENDEGSNRHYGSPETGRLIRQAVREKGWTGSGPENQKPPGISPGGSGSATSTFSCASRRGSAPPARRRRRPGGRPRSGRRGGPVSGLRQGPPPGAPRATAALLRGGPPSPRHSPSAARWSGSPHARHRAPSPSHHRWAARDPEG